MLDKLILRFKKDSSAKTAILSVAHINIAIILIGILFLLLFLTQQNNDALHVNLSGHQSVLIQTITKDILKLSHYNYVGDEKEIIAHINESITQYDDVIEIFRKGGTITFNKQSTSSNGITKFNDELNILYDEWLDFKVAVIKYTKKRDPESFNYIMDNNAHLLDVSNNIAKLLQEDSESKLMLTKFILFAIVFIEVLLYLFTYRNITTYFIDPLSKMMEAFGSIHHGKYNFHKESLKGTEWDIAFDTLQEMSLHLKTVTENLESLNSNLEEQVAVRTKDLNDKIIELEATYKKLIETEKQASLAGLVAGVAHEVNTPLGICITGVTKLKLENKSTLKHIQEGSLTKNLLKDYISVLDELSGIIDFNLNRAAEIIQSFKKIAVNQNVEIKENFYIDDYINEILISLTHELKRRERDIRINVPHIMLRGELGSYAQLFTNFIMNTLIHGYDEGEKVIIEISLEQKENNYIMKYKDYGKGINDKSINKIFDPFYTTNRSGGGSGLGLNVVYQIVTSKLQGDIKCHSLHGEFTEFIIEFPEDTNL